MATVTIGDREISGDAGDAHRFKFNIPVTQSGKL
jgi:hypothetical protein